MLEEPAMVKPLSYSSAFVTIGDGSFKEKTYEQAVQIYSCQCLSSLCSRYNLINKYHKISSLVSKVAKFLPQIFFLSRFCVAVCYFKCLEV